jgi:hypothetical protein
MEEHKHLTGSGRFPCRGGGCRHRDSGWFLYYDDKEFRLIFECDSNSAEHDLEIVGKWGDGSEIDKMRPDIQKWERAEERRRNKAMGIERAGAGR